MRCNVLYALEGAIRIYIYIVVCQDDEWHVRCVCVIHSCMSLTEWHEWCAQMYARKDVKSKSDKGDDGRTYQDENSHALNFMLRI